MSFAVVVFGLSELVKEKGYNMDRESYWIARVIVREGFHSSEIFESMEEARVWGRETALSIMRDLEVLENLELGDIRVEIDHHMFGYECSVNELINNSERVL